MAFSGSLRRSVVTAAADSVGVTLSIAAILERRPSD
jgi:hypothetical protein